MASLLKNPPWQLYALVVTLAFTIIFVTLKWAGNIVTPVLFAAIYSATNCLAHIIILAGQKRSGKLNTYFPSSMVPLALAIGFTIATIDITVMLMFGSGGPMSIAMPIYGAASVLIIVVFGFFILKEKCSHLQLLGIFLSIAGIALLNV